MTDTLVSCQALLAPILVFVSGMVVLLLDLRGRASQAGKALAGYAYFGLGAAALACVPSLQAAAAAGVKQIPVELTNLRYFGQGVTVDGFGSMLMLVLCVVAALVIAMSGSYLADKKLPRGEFYALILFASAGAMLMCSAMDWVNLFVGLEVLSVSLYILAGLARREIRSEEAAVKYFLLGAFASGFLLYGITLVYGSVGMAVKTAGITTSAPSFTNLMVMAEVLRETVHTNHSLATSPLFMMGIGLILVGLGFKASLVPFHAYAPDVYEGAPAPVAAFMSAVTKIGAFAALIRLVEPLGNIGHNGQLIQGVLWGVAFATMLVGNVLAVRQNNLKRMLAFSSVAHAGYLLVGVLAGLLPGRTSGNIASDAVAFYLLAYALMNVGAFALIVWLGSDEGAEFADIRRFAGLAKRNPMAAATMTVFMLSLSGIPLTAGFLGKLYLFFAATQAQQYGLAVTGLVLSSIGLVYYLNLVYRMYFCEPVDDRNPEVRAGGAKTVAVLCAVATLVLGIVPSGILGPVDAAPTGQLSIKLTPEQLKDSSRMKRPGPPAPAAGGAPTATDQ